MGKKYLLLWIEAPLQSWGCHSKFGPRDTCEFPTKSGIYGLFLCALGYQGAQTKLLERIVDLPQTVLGFKNSSPIMKDFQMVGSGYDTSDKWESLNIPRKADGGLAVASAGYGGTKMTYRYYIQNGKFAVIQEMDDDLCSSISMALQNPVFDLYFGRKNCVPSDLIFRGVFEDFDSAYIKAMSIATEEKKIQLDFIVSETEHSPESLILNDVPVSFGENKQYRDRRVYIKRQNGEFTLINQDKQE